MTKAVFARYVARITRDVAGVSASMAEGMGNPHFCASDAHVDAMIFIQDLRQRLQQIEDQLEP